MPIHVATLIILLLSTTCSRAEVLISESEAALPAGLEADLSLRGITRGPAIEQLSPASVASVHSPLALRIKFTARNNAGIDPTAVKASYLKQAPVDITDRLRKHTTGDGIDMPDAEVPPGKHLIRLEVKDSLGRASISIIKFTVEK